MLKIENINDKIVFIFKLNKYRKIRIDKKDEEVIIIILNVFIKFRKDNFSKRRFLLDKDIRSLSFVANVLSRQS